MEDGYIRSNVESLNTSKIYIDRDWYLLNGLKNYKSHVDVPLPDEENPKTGFWISIGTIGFLLTIGVGAIFVNKKMKIENKIIKL